jgi:hypothetical protein
MQNNIKKNKRNGYNEWIGDNTYLISRTTHRKMVTFTLFSVKQAPPFKQLFLTHPTSASSPRPATCTTWWGRTPSYTPCKNGTDQLSSSKWS